MKIALIANAGLQWLGGSQYLKNLAHALNSLPPDERRQFELVVAGTAGFDMKIVADLQGIADRVVDAETLQAPYSLPNRLRWKLMRSLGAAFNPRLEEWLRREGINFAYPCRVREQWSADLRFAAWAPDFQYDYYPDGSNPEEIAGRKADWQFLSTRTPCIVLSSGAGQADCHRLFPASIGKTVVLRFRVHMAPRTPGEDGSRVPRTYHLPERFFLLSNLFAPTKNHKVVFEALRILAGRGCKPVVACTGNIHDYRNPEFSSQIFAGIHKNGVNDQVRLLGIIPKRDQVELMRRCVSVLQPSLFEGWSTPVEECRLMGRPLLVSDINVHREQDVPGAAYFDPKSPDSLANVLQEAWETSPTGIDEDEARAAYLQLTHDYARAFLRVARGDLTPNEPSPKSQAKNAELAVG